jgi:hypothetical protein
MPGLGRKTWSPGDTLNAADVNGYLMDQSVMVFAGTAARASAIPTPSAGMVAYSTATSLQVYDGSAWVDLSTGYGVATGGTSSSISDGGINYTLLTFNSTATLTVSKAGFFQTFVAAGGGGGAYSPHGGGGGGAGGIVQATVQLAVGTYSLEIGSGGAGKTSSRGEGTRGGNSYFPAPINIVALGGGGGNDNGVANTNLSNAGGSGGGDRGLTGSGVGQAIANGQGNNGAAGTGDTNAGGGGGGYSAAGSTKNGGTALTSTFGGSSVGYAGGGGAPTAGTAGTNAGAGGTGTGAGSNATANRAGGGGGAYNNNGGNGGSGIIMVRFA